MGTSAIGQHRHVVGELEDARLIGGTFVGGKPWGKDVTYGTSEWTITEAPGEYADLVGSHGQAYPANAGEAGWRVLPFVVSEWGGGA